MSGKTAVLMQKQFSQNKNSLDLSEDNLDAHYGDNSLIVMKNDFYNDDFYDYKDTFLGKLDNDRRYMPSNSNGKMVNIETGEDYDDDLGAESDDDEIDYNNDFTTGPLAMKKNSQNDRESKGSGYDNDNFLDNGPRFRSGTPGEENEFPEDDYDKQDGMLMCETFFKRVDSMELTKPKKAKIIKNFLMGELLGDGSYGKVKECIDLETLSRRAVKIINLKMISRKIPRGVENVRKEINIMKRLNHKNLIKLYDTYEKIGQNIQQEQSTKPERNGDENLDELLAITSTMVNIEKPPKLYIFMDYCMTSLEKLLKTAPDNRLRNWQANHYFKQIIDGLEYLHSLNIIHNDIKPGNLLITCDDTLKICDFSISAELRIFYEHEYLKNKREEAEKKKNEAEYDPNTEINPQLIANNRESNSRNRFPIIQCTPMFQCPEMLDEDIDELMILKNAPKVDIWSTGITLFQLTTSQLPFSGQTIHQIFENIRSDSYEIKIPSFIDKNLHELLTNMLNRDPLKRWSIKQIRDCEWFRKKHPFVREDLANLPDEVIQNEYATFRMINYLEKLCQLKTVDELTSNDFNKFYEDISNQSPLIDQCQFANMNINKNENCETNEPNRNQNQESYYVNKNPVITKNSQNSSTSQQQNSSVNKSYSVPSQPKTYSQASKVKKSHCSLM